MSALTEIEIFNRMAESFRIAAEECEAIALDPKAGPHYTKMREHLRLIEGCCRQASAWREDTRWLPMGLMMSSIHKKAGDWLRRHNPRKQFTMLAALLRQGQKLSEELRDKRAPKSGMILPEMQRDPTERNAHVLVSKPPGLRRSAGGIIVP